MKEIDLMENLQSKFIFSTQKQKQKEESQTLSLYLTKCVFDGSKWLKI